MKKGIWLAGRRELGGVRESAALRSFTGRSAGWSGQLERGLLAGFGDFISADVRGRVGGRLCRGRSSHPLRRVLKNRVRRSESTSRRQLHRAAMWSVGSPCAARSTISDWLVVPKLDVGRSFEWAVSRRMDRRVPRCRLGSSAYDRAVLAGPCADS